MCSLEIYGNIPEHQNLNFVVIFRQPRRSVCLSCVRPKVKRA